VNVSRCGSVRVQEDRCDLFVWTGWTDLVPLVECRYTLETLGHLVGECSYTLEMISEFS
jgi:hypothetical protein